MRDPILTDRAKSMRRQMTEPETRLWLQLRARRFAGAKFRRQKVVGPKYVVDFASNDPKLVIEVDGDTHAERQAYDAERTRFLESEGYRVVRFTNHDVSANLDGVLHKIGEIIAELKPEAPPLPTLSPEGERAI